MQLDAVWIANHIPHAGTMCLLDVVESWSETGIVCRASSHRSPTNPLRTNDGLGIATGIEFAAQAIAVHSALQEGLDEPPSAGFLASVRDVQWHCLRLDDIPQDLSIRATRVLGNSAYVLYSFSLHADDAMLMSGRASIVVNAAGATP